MKVLEFIPLVVFFILYKLYGIIYATGGIVIVTLLMLVINFAISKQKPSDFVLFSSALIIVMGSFTVFTADSIFIKIKPTIFYSLCALVISIGLMMRKVFIKSLFSQVLSLDDRKWKNLSLQWVIFFLLAAILNEVMRSCFSEEIWINFKVIFMPLATLLFMFLQIFIYRKYLVVQDRIKR